MGPTEWGIVLGFRSFILGKNIQHLVGEVLKRVGIVIGILGKWASDLNRLMGCNRYIR
jgi:hypothetical protein